MSNIAIVGGGLVGSLLSIYMGQRGHQISVFEKRPDMRGQGEVGGRSINLALSDRGWKALDEVGISDHIRKLAIPMKGRMIHHLNGEQDFQPYGQEGQAIYSVSRGGLNLALDKFTDDHPKVDYLYNHKCIGFDDKTNRLSFLDRATNKKKDLTADVVFGADGAYSAIRWKMQKTKRFNYSQQFLDHGYKELSIPGKNGSWQLERNALHIWPRRQFMLIALPNLDGSFTCTLFLAFEGEESFENLQDPDAVTSFFKKWFPDAFELMPTLEEDFFDNPTDALVSIGCYPWSKGNNLLIGDAAHALVPFYGQGMNAGFEDCIILNKVLDQFTERNSTDWATAFDHFQKTRKKDTDAITELALQNFIEMRDRVADDHFLLRKKVEKHLERNFPEFFIPAYSAVTFSHQPYSEALKRTRLQEKVFSELMKRDDILREWTSGNIGYAADEIISRIRSLSQG